MQSLDHLGVSDGDEYEEIDDLIYERTGTLSFPYLSPIVDGGARTSEAAGVGLDAARAPALASKSPAWSSVGRLVRDLRAASAGTPGVSMLATVDVAGSEPPSTAKRQQPATAPAPSLAARHVARSRGGQAASVAAVRTAQRTTQPRLRPRPVRRAYPTFGQRVLAEVRRLSFAKRSAALAGGAAVVAAGAFIASSALVPRRAPPESAPTRSGMAAVDEWAPVPAPDHVGPHVGVVVAEERDEAAPDRPALDVPPTVDRPKRAKVTAGSIPTAPRPPRPRDPCDCLPGDPLCGCLD